MNKKKISFEEREKEIQQHVLESEKRYQELQKELEEVIVEKEFMSLSMQERYDMLEEMLNQFDMLGKEFRKVVDDLNIARDIFHDEIDAVRQVKNELISLLVEEVDRLDN